MGGDQYLEEVDTDAVRWRELGLRVTRLVLCFFFFSFLNKGDGGGWEPMGGGRDEEKCDLVGPSATNGGFDLPAKSHCCSALFKKKKTEWKHLFLIRFVASTLGSAASNPFMPQSSNQAIKEEKKRDGDKKRSERKR